MLEKAKFNNTFLFYRKESIDLTVIKESYEGNILLRWLPEYKIRKTHNLLDVGSHIGAFSVFAAQKANNGLIYSVEADPENYTVLQKNIEENGLNNIYPFNVALGGTNGKALLYHDLATGNWGHTICKKISDEYVEVPCVRLDSFFQENRIERIDLAKFNCEGAEFSIILNASTNTIRKCKNLLIFYHLDLEKNYSLSDLINYLNNNKFFTDIRFINSSEGNLHDRGCVIAKRYNYLLTKYLYNTMNQLNKFKTALTVVIKRTIMNKK